MTPKWLRIGKLAAALALAVNLAGCGRGRTVPGGLGRSQIVPLVGHVAAATDAMCRRHRSLSTLPDPIANIIMRPRLRFHPSRERTCMIRQTLAALAGRRRACRAADRRDRRRFAPVHRLPVREPEAAGARVVLARGQWPSFALVPVNREADAVRRHGVGVGRAPGRPLYVVDEGQGSDAATRSPTRNRRRCWATAYRSRRKKKG